MLKVLIVDDYKMTREILNDWLTERFPKIKIEEAANGIEAIKKIESHLPDLILMDIRLPGESGLELTKRIKEKYPAIIVVLLSSYESSMFNHIARQYGAAHFLSKSDISRDDFLNLVESLLRRK